MLSFSHASSYPQLRIDASTTTRSVARPSYNRGLSHIKAEANVHSAADGAHVVPAISRAKMRTRLAVSPPAQIGGKPYPHSIEIWKKRMGRREDTLFDGKAVDKMLDEHYQYAGHYDKASDYRKTFEEDGLVITKDLLPPPLRKYLKHLSINALSSHGTRRNGTNSVSGTARQSVSMSHRAVIDHLSLLNLIYTSPASLKLLESIMGTRAKPLCREFETDKMVVTMNSRKGHELGTHVDPAPLTVALNISPQVENSGGRLRWWQLPREAYGKNPELHPGVPPDKIDTIHPKELMETIAQYPESKKERLMGPGDDYLINGARIPHAVTAATRDLELHERRVVGVFSYQLPKTDLRSLEQKREVYNIEVLENYPEGRRTLSPLMRNDVKSA